MYSTPLEILIYPINRFKVRMAQVEKLCQKEVGLNLKECLEKIAFTFNETVNNRWGLSK